MVKLALSGVLASLVLTACPCDSGFWDRFADDFHRVCGGLPCDWELVSGQARLVPFLHGGERALELGSGAVMTRPLPDLVVVAPVEETIQVFVLATCEAATELSFELEALDDEGVGHTYGARLEVGIGGVDLKRRELPLSHLTDLPIVERLTFELLTLRVAGPGRCTLDDLHLVSTTASTCF
jgi:hypothetical protein